jgi:hypothetical protein
LPLLSAGLPAIKGSAAGLRHITRLRHDDRGFRSRPPPDFIPMGLRLTSPSAASSLQASLSVYPAAVTRPALPSGNAAGLDRNRRCGTFTASVLCRRRPTGPCRDGHEVQNTNIVPTILEHGVC